MSVHVPDVQCGDADAQGASWIRRAFVLLDLRLGDHDDPARLLELGPVANPEGPLTRLQATDRSSGAERLCHGGLG
jgi:hypothetical protein